jgi:signal transduction histidine kinase
MNGVITFYQIKSLDCNIRFEFINEGVESIYTDQSRLMQILHNLIGNALKYTKQGAVIVRLQQVNQEYRITVEDTGIGIDPRKQHLLFTSGGYGIHNNSANVNLRSSGLGLHFTKKIVKLLGGTLGYLPNSPNGSIFWLTLPAYPESDEEIELE